MGLFFTQQTLVLAVQRADARYTEAAALLVPSALSVAVFGQVARLLDLCGARAGKATPHTSPPLAPTSMPRRPHPGRPAALLVVALLGALAIRSLSAPTRTVEPTALHLAALGGHMETLEDLLGRRPNLEAADHSGFTALHWAALGGHLGAVERLLGAGANPKAASHTGMTPLHLAATGPVIRRLIASGADPNAADWHRGTPLGCTSRPDVVAALLDGGADPERRWAMRYLRGAGLSAPALHWAVYRRDAKLIRQLVQGGSDPNGRDMHGRTPLLWTFCFMRPMVAWSETDRMAMALLLLQLGADPGRRSRMPAGWLAGLCRNAQAAAPRRARLTPQRRSGAARPAPPKGTRRSPSAS